MLIHGIFAMGCVFFSGVAALVVAGWGTFRSPKEDA
jgi:hypothetical protein